MQSLEIHIKKFQHSRVWVGCTVLEGSGLSQCVCIPMYTQHCLQVRLITKNVSLRFRAGCRRATKLQHHITPISPRLQGPQPHRAPPL